MKIIVTQNHIDRGVRGSCYSCPVALATRDAGCQCVLHLDYLCKYNEDQKFKLPKEVRNFIVEHDAWKDVRPFEFDLEFRPVSS